MKTSDRRPALARWLVLVGCGLVVILLEWWWAPRARDIITYAQSYYASSENWSMAQRLEFWAPLIFSNIVVPCLIATLPLVVAHLMDRFQGPFRYS